MTFPGAGYIYTNNQRGLGSVTGRFGYTWGPGLLYVKGGYAYSDNSESRDVPRRCRPPSRFNGNHTTATPSAPASNTCSPRTGRPRSSTVLQLRQHQLRDAGPLCTGFGSSRNDEHTVKAGINYRFNWGGPVVARY